MTMTPEAKKALSSTIRGLRTHLLDALHSETEQTYRLSIAAEKAGLDEAARERRKRLEQHIDEQLRTLPKAQVRKDSDRAAVVDRLRRDVEKRAAYTLLGRVLMLRLLETAGLHKPAVVSGAWDAPGFKEFRQHAPDLISGDRSEGYAFLLQLVFEDLAHDLPGLYGPADVANLIPVPVDTWRHVVESLNDPDLATCWSDDMTLGWVYQYWNDPEREALDAKLHARGKLEPHEIASKTQMFTERYMVDWLLQNSLGPLWLAICAKNNWKPEVQADGTLDNLEVRRVEWRAKRDAGQVALTELMPLQGDSERRWAYYVPQPLPADAPGHAPDSVRTLKILDPAVGSGHFLVVAFDLLFALYREEARHRREADQPQWSDRAIVERILEHNLHGLDLDPRAIQIAAAALWLKARQTCPDARPHHLNLVAANLRLSGLPKDDPAVVQLRRAVERETAIPEALTDQIVDALRGADHLGSLLRIDHAVEEAIDACETALTRPVGGIQGMQGELLTGEYPAEPRTPLPPEEARATILDRLEQFLDTHTGADDLGLRLRGEQLATGIRFVRLLREDRYDLVVGNPPYQGTTKMADAAYVQDRYKEGKADLYAAFLQRGLQLVRKGGISAMLTMRNWMFIKQYANLRQYLLEKHDLRALGDFDRGAFEEVPDEVVSVVVSVFHHIAPRSNLSTALQPTQPNDHSRDSERTKRKRAATLAGMTRIAFACQSLRSIPEWPLVYWWDSSLLARYKSSPTLGQVAPVRIGLATGDNTRFLRSPWEIHTPNGDPPKRYEPWVPYIKGGGDTTWYEPMTWVLNWEHNGLEDKVRHESIDGICSRSVRSEDKYFQLGVSFSSTGSTVRARLHRFASAFDVKGQSVFHPDRERVVCLMNSNIGRGILASLNPSISFQAGDGARLPFWDIPDNNAICKTLEADFSVHESHREPSVEYRRPGPSPWRHAQAWAQLAVDRPEGAPLLPYTPEYDPEPATDHLSYALGVALGRFGADGQGILDPTRDDLGHALSAGILFLDGTLTPRDYSDGLGHPAATPLRAAWEQHGSAIAADSDLREYLASDFFDLHRKLYENRPIHWPLSSEKRTFVAWVTIHRWTANTLRTLLADHLVPRLTRLEGELADLRATREGGDKKAARVADKRFSTVQKWREELAAFIAAVEQCSDNGPPPEGPKCKPRAVDARYAPDLDDGVMINSAALWPLLAPQWKDPRKWWRELANAEGKQDYDWSHLAMRYWPDRVDAKCQADPSLAVAHGCFWRYHPARAWAWELRLQDELGPDFRLTEPPYRGDGSFAAHRAAFLRSRGDEAVRLLFIELQRRHRKTKKPLAEYALADAGLWSAHPKLCWDQEDALMQKQQAAFALRAPDEEAARAAYTAAHPDVVGRRAELLRLLELRKGLFDRGEPDPADDDDDPADAPEDDEEDA
ncbi:MAG: BREX-6 system adenine-specific DNA-methyltransferase PglX [Myxococcales bacterium]|nr:BREX-6 system adenine-specific DNA-methyltransferase PglX [Myxococcales bacterium]